MQKVSKLHILVILISIFIFSCQSANQNNFVKELPENIAVTKQLTTEFQDNYSMATWFKTFQSVSVKEDKVEVYTNAVTKNESVKGVCGGISFLFYSYSKSNQTKPIIIRGISKNILIQRNSIAELCN